MLESYKEVMHAHPYVAWSMVFVLALLVGSFFNAVIGRWPKMMKRNWWVESQEWMQSMTEVERADLDQRFNLCWPASHCVHCQKSLKIWHNIPLISFILLRGRCAFCQKAIAWRYPLVELGAALIVGGAIYHWGWTIQAACGTIFGWLLLMMSCIDLDEQLLPDDFTLLLMWIGLLISTQNIFINSQNAILGAGLGYISLWGFTGIFNCVTGKQGMGAGDFKLFAALGAWVGWSLLPLIIVLSSVVGILISIIKMLIQRRWDSVPIPFGPFLALSGWIALLWGQPLMAGYWNMFL